MILVRGWKRKKNLERGTLSEQDVTIEVSTGIGCRVILAEKSYSKKTIWWHRLWINILLERNQFLLRMSA